MKIQWLKGTVNIHYPSFCGGWLGAFLAVAGWGRAIGRPGRGGHTAMGPTRLAGSLSHGFLQTAHDMVPGLSQDEWWSMTDQEGGSRLM
jgi:hypothetical protein